VSLRFHAATRRPQRNLEGELVVASFASLRENKKNAGLERVQTGV